MKKLFVIFSIMIISFPVSAATLKQGDSSEQVVKLQQALLDGGYFSGTADGQFETMTEEAVRKYQEESGVTADGVVNDIQYMNLTYESIDNPGKSASDYDYADWERFAEVYEKVHVRDLQNDNYYVQDYIGKKLSDFCYVNDNKLWGPDYFGRIEYELANFGEKHADIHIDSNGDLYNYTVVYQDPMPDFSVRIGSSDKLTVRLGVIYSENLKVITSSGELTTPQPEEKASFIIINDEIGEYGESVIINKGTEFEETEIMYYIPAGKYSITNTNGTRGVQVSIYSGRPELVAEWEEFVADADCQRPVVLMPGETKDLEIKEGQFVVLSDDAGDIRFDMK